MVSKIAVIVIWPTFTFWIFWNWCYLVKLYVYTVIVGMLGYLMLHLSVGFQSFWCCSRDRAPILEKPCVALCMDWHLGKGSSLICQVHLANLLYLLRMKLKVYSVWALKIVLNTLPSTITLQILLVPVLGGPIMVSKEIHTYWREFRTLLKVVTGTVGGGPLWTNRELA